MTTINIQQDAKAIKSIIDDYLMSDALFGVPNNLYDTVQYIMTLPGKRLRPLMTILVAQGFDIPVKMALPAAASLEVFHNFTLVHDDIMDNAKLRRGNATVHEKYGVNKAIVTGDVMLPHAISLLINGNEDKATALVQSFLKMSKEVMEGQQFDMEFEERDFVGIEAYLEMIRLKTSVLFGCACEIGAILGNASEKDYRLMYDFGLNAGLAFQIMDDYLDTFGDSTFGKKIGGDILLNKKTFLLINALELAGEDEKKKMLQLFNEKNEATKIKAFQTIYKQFKVDQLAIEKMENYHQKAINALHQSSLPKEHQSLITFLAKKMLKRTV